MDYLDEIADRMALLLRPQPDSMSKKLDTIPLDFARIKTENAALKQNNAAHKTKGRAQKPKFENISVKCHSPESRVEELEQVIRSSTCQRSLLGLAPWIP